VRTIITSPEFFAASDDGVKVKTPFEFVASALRATGADVEDARPLVQQLRQMGMPLYMCQPPTGYADTAEAWMTSGALLARMNFAVALAANRMPGVVHPWPDGSAGAPSDLVAAILPDGASGATEQAVERAPGPVQALALALGSPDFQKR
ncbi:MAG TPA: DUF1800 family protein, partial [Vicinamibacterales bacterium]|nr:DUF1800 family protein [Vicinamibacterales bacterium]